MMRFGITRRNLVLAGSAALLAGCQVVPKAGPGPASQAPASVPSPEPSATALPTDETRHRVALLVPMTGANAAVGQSLSNATTMALLDTNAENIRITTYDTGTGASSAAAKAIADGNKLILGPLMGDNVADVRAVASPQNVPIITFSNDTSIAGADVFVLGHVPEQSIARSVSYARQRGSSNFAAIVPDGEYGRRAEAALRTSLGSFGGSLVGVERYARGNTSITSASSRLRARGGFDTVLVADGAKLSIQAAGALRDGGATNLTVLGTELLSGEGSISRSAAMTGTLFSAVSDNRFKRFSESYSTRFGSNPYRISTLGYDAVLLTLRMTRDWKIGKDFPARRLREESGFVGIDGPFRFRRNGIAERALEVREVRPGGLAIVSPAPSSFND